MVILQTLKDSHSPKQSDKKPVLEHFAAQTCISYLPFQIDMLQPQTDFVKDHVHVNTNHTNI